jgi:hypothetical protein
MAASFFGLFWLMCVDIVEIDERHITTFRLVATMRSPLGTIWHSDGGDAPKPTIAAMRRCLLVRATKGRGWTG